MCMRPKTCGRMQRMFSWKQNRAIAQSATRRDSQMQKKSRVSLNLFRALMRDARTMDRVPAVKFLLDKTFETSSTFGHDDRERVKESMMISQMMDKYQLEVMGPAHHYNPRFACESIAGVVRKNFKMNKDVPPKVSDQIL